VESSDEDPAIKKRFRIQRRRLGKIMYMKEDGTFGFIQGEDFREDVFFHVETWDGTVTKDGVTKVLEPAVEMWVEFELDDEHLDKEQRLRAKVVRPTDRPAGRKLSGRDATFRIVTHHKNARRKRPSWRK
jgi:cold shock CspA family protein